MESRNLAQAYHTFIHARVTAEVQTSADDTTKAATRWCWATGLIATATLTAWATTSAT
jgi:hypothetical protein